MALFNAIWRVVKNWEIQTPNGSWYSCTGDDVCGIIDSIAEAAPTVTVGAPAELIAKWRDKAQVLSHQNEISYLLVCANELESWWAKRTPADLDRQALREAMKAHVPLYDEILVGWFGSCSCQKSREIPLDFETVDEWIDHVFAEAALQVAGPQQEEGVAKNETDR